MGLLLTACNSNHEIKETNLSADIGINIDAVQVNREQERSQKKEDLIEIVNKSQVTEKEKEIALDEMAKLTENAETENAIQTTLNSKGIKDVIICIYDDGVDVYISNNNVTDEEKTLIKDIINQKTRFTSDEISIVLTE